MKVVTKLALFLIVLSLTVVTGSSDVLSKKRALIKKEHLAIAEAVRKIPINGPGCLERLSNMAADYIIALNYRTYAINNFLPNIAKDKFYEVVRSLMHQENSIRNDLQNAISSNCAQLREKLAEAPEKFNEEVIEFEKNIQYVPANRFVSNQARRLYDMELFALYKLKYQALFYEKTNKELIPEIGTLIEKLSQIINLLPNDKELVKDELRHALQHLYMVTAKCVMDLGDWIEINSDRVNDVKIVRKVSNTFSQLFNEQNRAANEDLDVGSVKQHFQYILQTGLRDVTLLADIEYPDKLGGEEFIRECLVYGLTIGAAYSDNLKALLLDA